MQTFLCSSLLLSLAHYLSLLLPPSYPLKTSTIKPVLRAIWFWQLQASLVFFLITSVCFFFHSCLFFLLISARNGKDEHPHILPTEPWALQVVLPFSSTPRFVAVPFQGWVSLKQKKGRKGVWEEESALLTDTQIKTGTLLRKDSISLSGVLIVW